MRTRSLLRNLTAAGTLAALLAVPATLAGFSRDTLEVIDATAFGTSTEMGKRVNIKLFVYGYSTPEDKKTLTDAFHQGQNQGLANALEKMRPVGFIQIPGTVGYDVGYIESIPGATGRKLIFITNRKIEFGEVFRDTKSQAYNLAGGEIDIVPQDQRKSTGVFYPAAQLAINSDGSLQIELFKNPWRFSDIIVRKTGEKK